MSSPGLILLQTPEGWKLNSTTEESSKWLTLQGGIDLSPERLAKEVAGYVEAEELSGSLALALDASATLAGSFDVDNLADVRDRRLLDFELEELLPIAVEEFVANYIRDGRHVLGVAAKVAELLPIVVAIEGQGLQVRVIAPTAVMAMQAFIEQSEHGSFDMIAWQNGIAIELFEYGKQLRGWRHLSSHPVTFLQQVVANLYRTSGERTILFVNCDDSLQQSLKDFDQLHVQSIKSESLDNWAKRNANNALNGTVNPWIDLHRDELASGGRLVAFRSEWRLCMASLAMVLLAFTLFCGIRSSQYEQLIDSAHLRQETIYREAFPDARLPSAVASRLRSEHAKLVGAQGSEAAVRLPPSALNVLYDLVEGLPLDTRLQVQQIRIEDGQVDLDANVRSVGDAGDLAESLQIHGFSIEPPTTEQRDPKTVAVRVHGSIQRNGAGN